MPELLLGTDSEHIRLSWPSALGNDDWGDIRVDIRVRAFNGAISPSVEGADLLRFGEELRALYNSLQGVAELSTRERQIGFKLTASSGGHIELTGEAWSEATYGNCLRFELELDQSFLQAPLKVLDDWESALNAALVNRCS